MTNKQQFHTATLIVVVSALALAAVAYLGFVFPKTLAAWADQARALSLVEQLVARLSMMCSSFVVFLLPLFGAGLTIGGMWMAAASDGDDKSGEQDRQTPG